MWLRKAEEGMAARAIVSFEKLSSKGVYEPTPEADGFPQLGEPKKIPGGAIVLVAAGALVGSVVTLLLKKK